MRPNRAALQVLKYVWTHPANHGKRVRSIGRAVVFQIRGRLGHASIISIGSNGRMWADLHSSAASKVLYANPPDWAEMRAWRKILEPGDVFIDVGSNVGSYALWAAGAGAQVIAVEPDPVAAQRLRRNVALNDYSIEVVEVALAAQAGTMRLSVGEDSTNHLLVDSSEGGTDVEVRTLDDIVGERVVAGVKIDVEGAERLVLIGAQRAIAERRISNFQIEWNAQSEKFFGETRGPIVAMLRRSGYEFMRPDDDGGLRSTDPTRYGTDVFAVAPTAMGRRL